MSIYGYDGRVGDVGRYMRRMGYRYDRSTGCWCPIYRPYRRRRPGYGNYPYNPDGYEGAYGDYDDYEYDED